MARYVVTEANGTTVVGGPYLWDGVTPFIAPEMQGQPTRRLLLETPARRNTGQPVPAADQNREALMRRAAQALDVNAAFLAIAVPTAAQNAAQAKALTRQVSALIRLTLGALDAVESD